MGFFNKVEQYINEKEKASQLKGISNRLRNNPNNKEVIQKLNFLYNEREQLKKEIEKKEIEIDFCINYLYYNDL